MINQVHDGNNVLRVWKRKETMIIEKNLRSREARDKIFKKKGCRQQETFLEVGFFMNYYRVSYNILKNGKGEKRRRKKLFNNKLHTPEQQLHFMNRISQFIKLVYANLKAHPFHCTIICI